jgi:hypothetical protein
LGLISTFFSPSRNAYLISVEHLPWLLMYSGPKTNTPCQNMSPSQLVKDTLCHEIFVYTMKIVLCNSTPDNIPLHTLQNFRQVFIAAVNM